MFADLKLAFEDLLQKARTITPIGGIKWIESEKKWKQRISQDKWKVVPGPGHHHTDSPPSHTASVIPIINNNDEAPVDYEKYGTPKERIDEWDRMVHNFKKGKSKNLTMSYGTGGVGKTYAVNTQLYNEIENGEVVKFTGGTTPLGFYEMLYNNRDKKIILDDFDMVFKDPAMLRMLASVSSNTSRRTVTYARSSASQSDIPQSFKFKGKVMIISNMNLEELADREDRKSVDYDAILTNSDKVNLRFNKQETWDLMDKNILHDKAGKPNPKLSFRDASGNTIPTSAEEKEDLIDYFKENYNNMTELSGRTLTKGNAIRKYYSDKGEDWRKYADEMLLDGGEKMDINQRFNVYEDALEMVNSGLLKSAIIGDKSIQTVDDYLEKENMIETTGENEYQIQSKPDYVASDDDTPLKNQYAFYEGGSLTEKGLYETLYKENGKLIVFNKVADDVIKSQLGQGLLKGALDTSGDGSICWLSSEGVGGVKIPKQGKMNTDEYIETLQDGGFNFEIDEEGEVNRSTINHVDDIPKEFKFKGRCIFVLNNVKETPQPIQSRSIQVNVNMNKNEFIDRAKYLANHRAEGGVGFSKIFEGITKEHYSEAIKYLEDHKEDIHKRHYSEEGLQTILSILSDEKVTDKNKLLSRKLFKGFHFDLIKAFQILIK